MREDRKRERLDQGRKDEREQTSGSNCERANHTEQLGERLPTHQPPWHPHLASSSILRHGTALAADEMMAWDQHGMCVCLEFSSLPSIHSRYMVDTRRNTQLLATLCAVCVC